MRIKLLFMLFLGFGFINPCFSIEEKEIVRVGISNQKFTSYEHYEAEFSSADDIKIVLMSVESAEKEAFDVVKAGKILRVEIVQGLLNLYVDNNLKHKNIEGSIVLSSNQALEIIGLNRKGFPAKYLGMIEIKPTENQKFNIINIIDMQNYLRGVVPNEMPISFGIEALKAQSVAARNYATSSKSSSNYDVVDSTASQVYYGANSYKDITDIAIHQTKGVYALYNEQPISALYFSTSAGITDDWDDVFGNGTKTNRYPYLKARYDYEKQKPLKNETDIIEFYNSKDTGFDVASPKFRWSFEYTREELEEVLHKTLTAQSKANLVTPKYNPDDKICGLKEIKPLKITQSGKVVELLIVAKNGEYKVRKENAIRKVLKKNNGSTMLPSANFYVEVIGNEKATLSEHVRPAKKTFGMIKLFDYIKQDKYPQKFRIVGGGFGHGVGMSQFGANAMAKKGYKFNEILKHYYTDINVSTMPKKVLYNQYDVWYKTEFYFDKTSIKEAYLIIDNQKRVSEFPFKINGLDFAQTEQVADNELVKINITQYLNDGVNTINFAPLSEKDKNKFIIYRVELL